MEAMTKSKWEDFPRSDLRMISELTSRGWKLVFNYLDTRDGRVTPDNVPHNPVGFKKGTTFLWKTPYMDQKSILHDRWTAADLVERHFVKHRLYYSIDEAIVEETGKPFDKIQPRVFFFENIGKKFNQRNLEGEAIQQLECLTENVEELFNSQFEDRTDFGAEYTYDLYEDEVSSL